MLCVFEHEDSIIEKTNIQTKTVVFLTKELLESSVLLSWMELIVFFIIIKIIILYQYNTIIRMVVKYNFSYNFKYKNKDPPWKGGSCSMKNENLKTLKDNKIEVFL